MTAPQTDAATDLDSSTALQQRLDAALAREATLVDELAARTADLQESLEYQTATSDVLKVISRSTFDLQSMLSMVAETAARLCIADQAAIIRHEGGINYLAANSGFPPEYEAHFIKMGPVPFDPVSPTVTHRAVGERRAIHVRDVAAVPGYPDEPIRLGRQRTSLGVPLLREGEPIGIILLARQRVEPFTERQIELVSTFADQAVIAIENTRLVTEQREAAERQTATAEVLQVINTSQGDLTPVFDAMLEKAMRLCGAAYGVLRGFDGRHMRTLASHGVPTEYAEFLARVSPPRPEWPADTGLLRALETGQPTQTMDARESVGYRSGAPGGRAIADLGGARTILHVPLVKDQASLGLFTLYRQEVSSFSDKQIALLESFAAQAVIAMENARLLTEQREALEQQTATAEVLQVINASPGNLTPVFDAMLEKAMRLCSAAFGSFYTYDGEQFLFAAQRGLPQAFAAFRAQSPLKPVPGSQLAQAIENRQTLHVLDLKAGDLYRIGNPFVRAMVDLGGVRTILTLPLCKDETVLGFLSVYRQEVRAFSDKQIVLLENFAAQAVIAMENARLLGELRNALDAAQAALRDLKTAQANLIQAEKMASLGQLTAGIAHEIKNPLNFVNNFAALSVDLLSELKETAASSFAALTEKQRAEVEDVSAMLTSNLEKITEHGKRADGIVKAMLEHSRGSSAERRMVDLNALIDEALNLAYHGARAQDQKFDIMLERGFGKDVAPIEVNPQDMTRVFLNIFSNGFYASTRRARSSRNTGFVPMLKVTTRNVGEMVEIRVRDNGTGIPNEIRDRLFQPFFTTKPTGEGTGLGLSITYDIVTKQHGGTITVDSEVDGFAEFIINLPR